MLEYLFNKVAGLQQVCIFSHAGWIRRDTDWIRVQMQENTDQKNSEYGYFLCRTDDSTFFLKNIDSVKNCVKIFVYFSQFSGLVAGTIYFRSANRSLKETNQNQIQNNFVRTSKSIQMVLPFWCWCNPTVEGDYLSSSCNDIKDWLLIFHF